MEYIETGGAADDNMADPHLNKPMPSNKSERSSEPAQSPPKTAIDRQIAAATSARNYDPKAYGAAAPPRDRRKKNDRRKTKRFGLGSFLVLLWLVVIGVIVIFTDFDRTLQKMVSDVSIAEKTTANETATSPKTSSSSTASATTNTEMIAETNKNSETTTPAAEKVEALSIPIADVSLRNRPELVEQLVQVYRSQLAANPQDAATRTALDRLQERSLSDIQTLIAEGDITKANKGLDITARVFPELNDNVRYKYLLARTEYMHRQATGESTASAALTAPASTNKSATPSATKTAPASTAVIAPKVVSTIPASASTTAKPVSTEPIVSSPKSVPSSSISTDKKSSASASSSKPEIRSISIVPGTIVNENFVPSDGGNVFMVELSYSNFDRAFVEHPAATLVTLLGVPEDSMVLAEVPTIITADRGTKSFLMETNDVHGYAGGKFQLEFLLNGEFLTSRNVRLSKPRS